MVAPMGAFLYWFVPNGLQVVVPKVAPKGLRPTVFQRVSIMGSCAAWIVPKGRSHEGSCPTVFPDGLCAHIYFIILVAVTHLCNYGHSVRKNKRVVNPYVLNRFSNKEMKHVCRQQKLWKPSRT